MVTTTGFEVSETLKQTLLTTLNPTSTSTTTTTLYRLITCKPNLELGTFELLKTYPSTPNKTWKQDFDLLKEASTECGSGYYFYTVEKGEGKYSFILFSFIHDNTKVKERMVIAGSKTQVVQSLGQSNFEKLLHITQTQDFTYENFEYTTSQDRQVEQKELDLELEKISLLVDHRPSTSQVFNETKGLSLNLDPSFETSLHKFLNNGVNLVLLHLEGPSQILHGSLDAPTQIPIDQLSYYFPTDTPRFALYKLIDQPELKFLLYVCPSNSKIKDKMVYSSFILPLQAHLKTLNLDMVKVEVDDANDLDEPFLKQRLPNPLGLNQREVLAAEAFSFTKPEPPTTPSGQQPRPRTRGRNKPTPQ